MQWRLGQEDMGLKRHPRGPPSEGSTGTGDRQGLSARGSKRAKHGTFWAQGGGAETRTLLWGQITPDARVHAWASHDGQRKHTLLGRKVTVRLYLERQLWQDAGRDGIPDQG